MGNRDSCTRGAVPAQRFRRCLEEQLGYMSCSTKYNQTRPLGSRAERRPMLRELRRRCGEGGWVSRPSTPNLGAPRSIFGRMVLRKLWLTMWTTPIFYVGTAPCSAQRGGGHGGHPILAGAAGSSSTSNNMPVRIGRNCWIGAGAIILPGIKPSGTTVVVGAGSGCDRDLPDKRWWRWKPLPGSCGRWVSGTAGSTSRTAGLRFEGKARTRNRRARG